MSLLAVKLRRDLRAVWSRMLLMTVAIAVGLIVFGGVFYAWAVIDRESADAYEDTGPASATLVFGEPVDAELMAAIVAEAQTRPQILQAVGRAQFRSDIAVDGTESEIPLQVFAAEADDPMDMVRFEVEDGSWPPGPEEIYIGRDSLDLLDVSAGDAITLTAPGGRTLELRVAGTVYDPSLAPAVQEQTGRAYLSTTALGASAALNQLKIQVAEPEGEVPSRDRGTVAEVAAALADDLQDEYGLTVEEVQVPEPYTHPHQSQANTLMLAILGGCAAALVLSAVLVANMLGNLFTQQIPQIGIMKAVGARTGRIGRFYTAMTLAVAVAATAVAPAPAALLGRAGAAFFLEMLGVQTRHLAAPWWVWAVVVAAGIALPPLTALVPVVKASRTTVRQAIDHHGLTSAPSAASAAVARLSRIPLLARGLDRGTLLALRNTLRRPARFALAAGLLAGAGTVFVAGMSLGASTEAIDGERKAEQQWDVVVELSDPAAAAATAALIEELDGVTRAEGWTTMSGSVSGTEAVPVTRTYPDQGHGRLTVVAVPLGTRMLAEPELLEGRWLEPGETGALVLNQVTRDTNLPEAEIGDTVRLVLDGEATEWTLAGVVQERLNSSGLYVTAEGLAEATGEPPRANQLRIATAEHDEATRDAVAASPATALAAAGLEVESSESVSRVNEAIGGHLDPIIAIMLALAIVMGVIGAIGLASTMSANVLDRTREFGVMHAIGARPKAVRRVVVTEGVFLALASCVLAVIPALVLTAVLGAGVGQMFVDAPLPYRISWVAASAWAVLVVLGAVLATEAAASRASRITVREALAYL